MNQEQHISRRNFLKTAGGFTFFIGTTGILSQLGACQSPAEAVNIISEKLTAWVHLASDGSITIYNPAAEMGQGSMTSLPVIFAEEMDADWEKVKVEFSPQEEAIYGAGWSPQSPKVMMTVGSRTIRLFYNIMRQAGAQARQIILQSTADHWQLPIEELSTKNGKVIHEGSGKAMDYGETVSFLKIPEDLPDVPLDQLKDPKDFRLIGKDIPRYDIPAKSNGSAQFAMDVQLPNMLYAVIERGNLHGAKPTLQNEETIKSITGVVDIIPFDYGIGIMANSIHTALSAKKQLKIEWSEATPSGFNSQEIYKVYESKAAQKGKAIVEKGDFKKALSKAAKVYRADYKNDYVYHAQMEPLNAVVQLTDDAQSAEVWVGSQSGSSDKKGVAKALGLEPAQVKVHLCYLGGGLGRRSRADSSIEAATFAKTVPGRPVKLIWTRQDDLHYGMYRPLSLQRLTACTDEEGNVTGFSHKVIGDGERLLTSGIRNEFYDIPNQYAAVNVVPNGVRVKHWRAVGHGPNKFAIECMIDEIARDQGKDPIEFRRALMKDYPRALTTLNKAAEMSNWGAPLEEGRARGVAFLERSGALSTGICEISLDESTGKIKVHHFWSANDAGVIIHPDNVKAQMEGGIIMGIGSVLREQLTIEDGRIQQSNFHDYHIARMEDTPESIETALIESSEAPQGVGESGTPLVACAIANAFLALTGKSLRHLPFTPERVLEVLS